MPTSLKPFTINNLKPPADKERWSVFFGRGLGMRVTKAGTKTWIYQYRHEGRLRMMTLGTYPDMSIEQASAAHAAARQQHRAGAGRRVDPIEAKRQALAQQRAAAQAQATGRATLRQAFGQWKATDLQPHIEQDGTRLGRKDGGAVTEQVFNKWLFPTLGDKPAADVTRADLMAVVDAAKAEGKRRTAQWLFSNLRQMLDFAADRGIVPANPLASVKKARAVGRATVRKRTLADWEITRLLARLPVSDKLQPARDVSAVTVLALRFVLTTGQRPGEVAGMRKDELSKDGTLWTVPAARYKTGEAQLVPLSKLARQLLAQAAAFNHGSGYVFPSAQDTKRPLDRHSLSRALLRKLGTATPQGEQPAAGTLGLAPFTPHDLRRTCRTGLAALGVPDVIAERVIGHKLQGMLAVYNQHDYLEERRDALQKWSDKLDALAR